MAGDDPTLTPVVPFADEGAAQRVQEGSPKNATIAIKSNVVFRKMSVALHVL